MQKCIFLPGLLFVQIGLILQLTGCVHTKIETIKLPVNSADQVEAIYGVPEGEGKFPSIIYNHGNFVRKLGYWEAATRGYDVRDFVNALVQKGFVALAPIRKTGRLHLTSGGLPNLLQQSPDEWTSAQKEGIAITSSAIQFLQSQPNVRKEKIGIIGYSEGGSITLWSSFEQQHLKAIVLMSPADIKQTEFSFREACKKVEAIKAPVFLTLGKNDFPGIIKSCLNLFIPRMKQLDKEIEYKIDYPGDHNWFHKVREEYWNDIILFLNKKLSN